MTFIRTWLPLFLCLCPVAAFAAVPAIPFTVTMSESVNVTGSPRIVLNVDGNARYAVYAAGTGTASLTFTYTATAGDVDLNGIGIASTSVDLNGGTVTDLNGNPLTNLTFTAPANMASVNVNYPSLAMDFIADADGRYSISGTVYNDLTSFLTAAGGTFTRASTATYFDSAGTLQTAATNSPRFDYDPVTHAAKGLLVEESSTNQMGNSELVGSWAQTNVSVSSNTVQAPDGTTTADTVTTTGGNGLVRQTVITAITAGQTITRTLFAKAGTTSTVIFEQSDSGFGATRFNVSTCVLISAPGGVTTSTQQLPNGWCRIRATRTFTTAGSWQTVYIDTYGAAAAGMSVHLWGGQMEAKSFPTSYIPTTSATVTRSADRLLIPVGAWFGAAAGTWNAYFDGGRESTQGLYGRVVAFNGAATALSTDCGATTTVGTWNGTSPAICSNTGTDYYTTAGGAASAYDEGSMTHSLTGRGLAPATGAYTGTYVATGNIALGGNVGSASNMLNGHIQKMRYYPQRASGTQLQLLTQ